MAELKTQKTDASVEKFIKSVKDAARQKAASVVLELMKKVTKTEPKMWGSAIIGFGSTRLKYESGRELDWFPMGFSPRKQNLALYITGGQSSFPEILKKLGKHKTGKGCIYIDKIEDVDVKVLEQLLKESMKLSKSKK